jgi:hypothetical protein
MNWDPQCNERRIYQGVCCNSTLNLTWITQTNQGDIRFIFLKSNNWYTVMRPQSFKGPFCFSCIKSEAILYDLNSRSNNEGGGWWKGLDLIAKACYYIILLYCYYFTFLNSFIFNSLLLHFFIFLFFISLVSQVVYLISQAKRNKSKDYG